MSRRLKVLHVITRLEPGGAQRNTLHTVATLDRGNFVPGLAWGPGELLDPVARALTDVRLFEVPALVRPIRPRRDVAAVRALRTVVRSFAPDVVHTHSSKAGILGRLAARLERVPAVVHTVHGWGFTPNQSRVRRALFVTVERLAARWTHHFVAVSNANLVQGRRLGIIPHQRGSVIRSGIHLERFRSLPGSEPVRARLGIPPGASIVTQIGNFKPQKAPLDFVRVAGAVARRFADVWFVMVGEGPLKHGAEALASELGVAARMVLPGWWEDVAELLAVTRVSVLTSRHEGLPRAVVESLAAGVPVVATAVDGTPEVVRNDRNGFLVEPGDVAGLARAVIRLLDDDEVHARLSAAAPQGLEDFDIDTMVRQQEELYQCLASRRST